MEMETGDEVREEVARVLLELGMPEKWNELLLGYRVIHHTRQLRSGSHLRWIDFDSEKDQYVLNRGARFCDFARHPKQRNIHSSVFQQMQQMQSHQEQQQRAIMPVWLQFRTYGPRPSYFTFDFHSTVFFQLLTPQELLTLYAIDSIPPSP